MNETIFFESFGSVVVAIQFQRVSERVIHFRVVQAIDYPQINEIGDSITVDLKYFNFIGPDSEVVDEFNDSNLIAAGNIVFQTEDKKRPIAYTIEFSGGIIFTGKEFTELHYILNKTMLEKAFLFFQGEDFGSIEKVPYDFQGTENL